MLAKMCVDASIARFVVRVFVCICVYVFFVMPLFDFASVCEFVFLLLTAFGHGGAPQPTDTTALDFFC